MILTGANSGACYGDSGGPLAQYNFGSEKAKIIVGVTSSAKKDCDTILNVFTRVDYFMDWIVEKIKSFPEICTIKL